jgi:hypothetical protein
MIEDPLTTETDLREKLGLPARSLQKIRATLAESDWKKEGRGICYTEEGVKKIMAALELPDETTATAATAAASVALVVVRATRNAKILMGRAILFPPGPAVEGDLARVFDLDRKSIASLRFQRLQKDEDWVIQDGVTYTERGIRLLQDHLVPLARIRVRDARKFRTGMVLECEPTETPGLFVFRGKAPKIIRKYD